MLTETPGLETFKEAPERKLVPVRVTGTLVPCVPLDGLTAVRVGVAELMVKMAGEVVPLEVETVTLVAPEAALEAMAKEAVI